MSIHFKRHKRQLKILQNEQCNEIRGYLFSHPLPIDRFGNLLQKGILSPIYPELKALQNKRTHYRLNFPYPLAADMSLVSIKGQTKQLEKSSVLIEDMSAGGLRYISMLKLPVRGDVIFQFETEILGQPLKLIGSIVWKEEINEDLVEYGIKLISDKDEQTRLDTLLTTFQTLLNNSKSLPPYNMVTEDIYKYFSR